MESIIDPVIDDETDFIPSGNLTNHIDKPMELRKPKKREYLERANSVGSHEIELEIGEPAKKKRNNSSDSEEISVVTISDTTDNETISNFSVDKAQDSPNAQLCSDLGNEVNIEYMEAVLNTPKEKVCLDLSVGSVPSEGQIIDQHAVYNSIGQSSVKTCGSQILIQSALISHNGQTNPDISTQPSNEEIQSPNVSSSDENSFEITDGKMSGISNEDRIEINELEGVLKKKLIESKLQRELDEFEHLKKKAISLAADEILKLDFKLKKKNIIEKKRNSDV